MDEPVGAYHFLGIDICLHDAEGRKLKCVLSQYNFCQHVLKYVVSISPGLVFRKFHTPASDALSVLGMGDEDKQKCIVALPLVWLVCFFGG